MRHKSIQAIIIILSLLISLGASCKKSACVEHPKEDCVCTMEYNPVCGCNHKTYSNPCAATCAGIESYTMGPCKTEKNRP